MADIIDDTDTFTITLETPPPADAKGEIVSLTYPASAEHNEAITIEAAVTNVGESPGQFYLRLYRGTNEVYEYEIGTIAAGATSPVVSLPTTTPASGASVSYTVKCSRIT